MYREYKQSRSGMDIAGYVKQVLEAELTQSDPFLSSDDITELLDEEHADEDCREGIVGYPTRPLYKEIANQIAAWIHTKKCPVEDLPSYDLLDEKDYIEKRHELIESLSPQLEGLLSLWDMWAEEERCYKLRELLKSLQRRGLLDLLGLRKTFGTVEIWPPPRKVIEATFQSPHKPNTPSVLTVGARALAKHHHRDNTASWWGTSTGSEAEKNDHATKTMNKILDNATWLNIHQLPHNINIIEARQENGYGVRWTCDGKQFRGFLEPQMVDGHEVGWKH